MIGRFTKLEQVLTVSTMMNEFKAKIVSDNAKQEKADLSKKMKQQKIKKIKDLSDYEQDIARMQDKDIQKTQERLIS